jgi:mannose-6-phosphate isomerase-like protein (cupin superfamily)
MIVRRRTLQAIEFGDLEIHDYTANSNRNLGSSLATIEVPSGAVHPQAWSKRSDKFYLVMKGEIQFSLEDEEFRLETNDFCLVEQGKRFAYRNDSGESATLLLVHTPSFDLDSEIFTS